MKCRRDGDHVYCGDERVGLKIESLKDLPAGLVAAEVSITDAFQTCAYKHARSKDGLAELCGFLLLPVFATYPFPVGKELALIYGSLKRQESKRDFDRLSEDIIYWDAELAETDNRRTFLNVIWRSIKGELFGRSIVNISLDLKNNARIRPAY